MQTIAELYLYFDQLIDDASADELFCSSYLRGFITIAAQGFGDEQQLLSKALADVVSAQLSDAADELSADDRTLVADFWQPLAVHFCH